VTILLDAGTLVNIEPGSKIPLSMAAAMGDQELVKTLIKAVADTTPQSESAYLSDPLCRAAGSGEMEMCCLLLDQGAKPNDVEVYKDIGPLEFAAERGHIRVVRLLVARGCLCG
jgi:ankyrin repeat protein